MLEKGSEIIGFDVRIYLNGDYEGSKEWCYWSDASSGRCGLCIVCCPDEVEESWCMDHVMSHRREITMKIYYNSGCVPYTDPYTGESGCYSPSGAPIAFGDATRTRVSCKGMPRCCPDHPPYRCWLYRWDAYLDSPDKCAGIRKKGGFIFCARERPVLLKTDTCSGADLSGCRLKDEQICQPDGTGCIWTVRDFAETGIWPMPDCVQRGSDLSGAVWTVCVDGRNMTYSSTTGLSGTLETGEDVWWMVRRTYYCPRPGLYDLDDARARMSVLEPSVSLSGDVLYWSDYLPGTGERYQGLSLIHI